jgi:hypothetical protein
MKDDGCNSLFEEVSVFCAKNIIIVPNMTNLYQSQSRRKAQIMKKLHHYRIELYYIIIDIQLQELNRCFDEVNFE